jgi:NAD kinase
MKKIEKIDIVGGQLTFEQRIELGRIISSGGDNAQALLDVMRCLHGVEVNFSNREELKWYIIYFEEVLKGIAFWVEQEKRLKYEPTPEELQAGIEQMTKNIGEYATLLAIAQAYKRDPDEVLDWKYGKVFGILLADFEKAKFQRSLQGVYERKCKVNNRMGSWRQKR